MNQTLDRAVAERLATLHIPPPITLNSKKARCLRKQLEKLMNGKLMIVRDLPNNKITIEIK